MSPGRAQCWREDLAMRAIRLPASNFVDHEPAFIGLGQRNIAGQEFNGVTQEAP